MCCIHSLIKIRFTSLSFGFTITQVFFFCLLLLLLVLPIVIFTGLILTSQLSHDVAESHPSGPFSENVQINILMSLSCTDSLSFCFTCLQKDVLVFCCCFALKLKTSHMVKDVSLALRRVVSDLIFIKPVSDLLYSTGEHLHFSFLPSRVSSSVQSYVITLAF